MKFVRLDQERVVYILTGERRLLAKSEMGQKATSRVGRVMSALPSKADINRCMLMAPN